MHRLKGQKGSKVKIGVRRFGEKETKYFILTRGDITMKSITATYMLDDSTGYMRIKNFGERTYAEMLASLQQLNLQGADHLVIDLRDNSGGYLESAVQMAEEFLKKDQLVVYTEGRKSPRKEYRSRGKGSYQQIPLVVLINEGSASASEIFAGAIQDNDRGVIIGSALLWQGTRTTTDTIPRRKHDQTHHRTLLHPLGRCIQKPFKPGDNADYEQDLLSRYQHGEFFSQDSIKHTGPAYHTNNGRIVYGGGGITPDIFVPEDTTAVTSYYKEAAVSGLILQYAFQYTDNNRQTLKKFTEMQPLSEYLTGRNLVNDFANYAEKNGLRRRNNLIRKSHGLLENYINSRIIYNMLDEQAWNQYLNRNDEMIRQAREVFKKGAAFPSRPIVQRGTLPRR